MDQKSVLPHKYCFLLLQLINDVKLDKAGNISKLNSHIVKVNTEVFEYYYINVREYRRRRGNKKKTIQRNWQHWVHRTQDEDKQNKNTTQQCVGHHYAQTNTNNINKT